MNSPLHYYGGKGMFRGKLAKWIVSNFCPHTHYAESCFGGGSVLLNREKISGVSEAVNDIDGRLINFWKVLANKAQFEDFYTRVSFLPVSEELWQEAVQYKFGQNDVEDAVQYFILNRQSRLGANKKFITTSKRRTRRGINEQVATWFSAIDNLPEITERLESVVIRNTDLFTFIREEDSDQTLFYLDPPYLHGTRTLKNAYKFEMTEKDHEDMLKKLTTIKGKFCLSGYESDLYKKYATLNGWHVKTMEVSKCSSSSKKKEIKTEVIWTNYPMPV
jgi:DNA adenine methylase